MTFSVLGLLFLVMPWVDQCVIVVFPGHILFFKNDVFSPFIHGRDIKMLTVSGLRPHNSSTHMRMDFWWKSSLIPIS